MTFDNAILVMDAEGKALNEFGRFQPYIGGAFQFESLSDAAATARRVHGFPVMMSLREHDRSARIFERPAPAPATGTDRSLNVRDLVTIRMDKRFSRSTFDPVDYNWSACGSVPAEMLTAFIEMLGLARAIGRFFEAYPRIVG